MISVDGLSQLDIFALTLHHEAGGEPLIGMQAVACVIRNRVAWKRWGTTYTEVCLAPGQFSCWNEGNDKNHVSLLQNITRIRGGIQPSFMLRAYIVARETMDGILADVTTGADHYWSPKAMKPVGRVPEWARGRESQWIRVGNHIFLKLRKG